MVYQKGNIPWNKNINGYSTSWKGRHHSEGTKINIGLANRFHHQGDWAQRRVEYFKKWGWKCIVLFAEQNKKNKKQWIFDKSEKEIEELVFFHY